MFLQGKKSRIRLSPLPSYIPFHNHFYLFIHPPYSYPTIFHHTSTTYIGPHTCTSWFDCMTHFSGSVVWLYNICLQVCMSCLPTYELYISLLVIGWEREGTMLLCLMPKIPHILREERMHIPLMPWWEFRNTTKKRLERVIYRNLWVLFKNLAKNSRIIVDRRAWNMALDLTILSFNCSRPKWR
jgi:hypothetical protein